MVKMAQLVATANIATNDIRLLINSRRPEAYRIFIMPALKSSVKAAVSLSMTSAVFRASKPVMR